MDKKELRILERNWESRSNWLRLRLAVFLRKDTEMTPNFKAWRRFYG